MLLDLIRHFPGVWDGGFFLYEGIIYNMTSHIFGFMTSKFVSKRILTYRGDYANLYTKHISWKIYISYF